MGIKRQLARECQHPLVWIGGLAFVSLGLISRWIGGNPRSVLLYVKGSPGTVATDLFLMLWTVSLFVTGGVFGAMFVQKASCQLRSYRAALLIVVMQVFAWFAYPLFFACYAWMLALMALILSMGFCIAAFCSVRRISFLGSVSLIVHFALLLWTAVCVVTVILMN